MNCCNICALSNLSQQNSKHEENLDRYTMKRNPAMTEACIVHPSQHADNRCWISLLTEAASDHFPNLFTDIEQSEVIHAAAATVADFTAALIDGLHGRGCPVREELDIAAITNSEGYRPYCAQCGAEIHIFLGLAAGSTIRVRAAPRR